MTTALAERPVTAPAVTGDQLDLVKRTVANGATDAELKLYLYDCQRQGVHPLDRLLHFTKRGGKYTPVTSIDLMRIRAAETGEYAGSDDASFLCEFDDRGREDRSKPPIHAQVTVWRLVQGTRCAFTATARWSEYYPGDQAGTMWRKMPHTMLAKCAEALALRKGFPRQLAGLYAAEELDQANRQAPAIAGREGTLAPTPSQAVVLEPSVPNGGDSGAFIDTTTGEERPAPPKGYFYAANYRLSDTGWHEFDVLGLAADGGAMRLSTKKNIGYTVEQAIANGLPIKVTTAAKKNARPGEAYLDSVSVLKRDPVDLPPDEVHGEMVDADSIPF